jgi:hypothetical protein
MDLRATIKTGDALLFSGNSPTGIFLRTFISSEWNHSGIGVRFKTLPGSRSKVISLDEEGDLYILETTGHSRWDHILERQVSGVGFSAADVVFERYNKVAVRRLRDIFRTDDLARLTLDFGNRYSGYRFPSGNLPFMGAWLGIPLAEQNEATGMFCSQFVTHYYPQCLGPQYTRLTGLPFDGTLASLFGTGAPPVEEMYTPGHYAASITPHASIFDGPEEIVYLIYADLLYIIFQPLIIILFAALIFWMLLP